jgi:hypothetical protein
MGAFLANLFYQQADILDGVVISEPVQELSLLFQSFNRHSREGGNPKSALSYGFPPSRE